MTGHEKFMEGLREQSNQVNYSGMTTTEIISRVLQENGVSQKMVEHPEFKKRMTYIFEDIINHRTGTFEEAIKNLKEKVITGFTRRNSMNTATNYEFHITEDGNLEIDSRNYEIDEHDHIIPQEGAVDKHTFFTIDEGNNLTEIETSSKTFFKEYDIDKRSGNKVYNPEFITDFLKKQKVYNRDGLQMQEIECRFGRSDKRPYLSDSDYMTVLNRNSDLTTGAYTVYEKLGILPTEVMDKHSKIVPGYNNRSATTTIEVGGQYPERLSGPRPSYENVVEFNKREQEKRPDHGTEAYEQLLASNGYSTIAKPVSEDEKKYYREQRKIALEATARYSPIIKKVAERMGLIDSKEVEQK